MVRLRVSWRFSLSSAPTVGNPCRPLQPETVSVPVSTKRKTHPIHDPPAGNLPDRSYGSRRHPPNLWALPFCQGSRHGPVAKVLRLLRVEHAGRMGASEPEVADDPE